MKIESHPVQYFDERPPGTVINTIVIHSMFAPDAPDPCDAPTCILLLSSNRVSAHYLIDRSGVVWQTVDDDKRAWHAGESRMPFADDTRENVNHFSIGIELLRKANDSFTDSQYQALAQLCTEIRARLPITSIVGHDHIAPARKADPGPQFDWERLRTMLQKLSNHFYTARIGVP